MTTNLKRKRMIKRRAFRRTFKIFIALFSIKFNKRMGSTHDLRHRHRKIIKIHRSDTHNSPFGLPDILALFYNLTKL